MSSALPQLSDTGSVLGNLTRRRHDIDYNISHMYFGRPAKTECILDASALLGESPVWCPIQRLLYWVDIVRPAIHCFDPATACLQSWLLEEQVGSIALRQHGGAVAALRSGFAFFDFLTGETSRLPSPVLNESGLRFNDGRCDRHGRF